MTNKWNSGGLLSSIGVQQSAGSFMVSYLYDSARRLTSVTSPAGTFKYYFAPSLNSRTISSRLVQELVLPNTSYITNLYDSQARLTDTSLKQSSGTILDRHSYAYNYANERTQETRTDASYVNFGYDKADQLQSALGYTSGGTPLSTEQKGYTYDPAWNLSARTNNGVRSTLTLDSQNQITTGLGSTYTWDSNGNRSTRSDNGTARYTYDDENQLVYVDKDPATYSSPPRTDYVYDGLGRMRKRTEYQWNGSVWNFQSETRYIYAGNLVIQERDSSNNPNVADTRGIDLSGTFEGAGGIGGLLARSSGYSAGSWSTHHDYHADGVGNITALVDSSQTISASYRYDSYGNLLSSSGTMAAANLYRFSSKQFQTNSTLYYYGYRFYDPLAQRWLNRDPLGELGFEVLRYRDNISQRIIKNLELIACHNLYCFVRNEPTRFFDSFGLVLGDAKCARAIELAEAARELYESEPSSENAVAWLKAVDQMMIDCEPPPPPDPEPEPDPVPVGPPGKACEIVEKTCFWTTVGVVTYWVCSEASRVLFPPRNLIPIP